VHTLTRLNEGGASVTAAPHRIDARLNSLILKQNIFSPGRFSGITLQEKTKELLGQDKGRNEARLNRLLLADAYPQELAFQDGILQRDQPVRCQVGVVLDSSASSLDASAARLCCERYLRTRCWACTGVINAGLCFLVFLKLGWPSVVCVFLSYFFMSIHVPTIFALGIFGLGVEPSTLRPTS